MRGPFIRIKKTDASKLQDEYQKLVEGLQDAANAEDSFASNPSTPSTGVRMLPALTWAYIKFFLKIYCRRQYRVIFAKRNISLLFSNDSWSTLRSVPRDTIFAFGVLTPAQTRMRVLHVVAETPPSFLQHLKDITYIERRPLRLVFQAPHFAAPMLNGPCFRFCAERLQSLVKTLELSRIDEFSSLQKVANFATLVSTYEKGVFISSLSVGYF